MSASGFGVWCLVVCLAVWSLAGLADAKNKRVKTLSRRTLLNSILQNMTTAIQNQNTLHQRFNNFDQRINAMDQRFERLDERLSATDQRFNSIDQRLTAIDERLNGLAGGLAGQEGNVDSTNSSVIESETNVPFRITRVENTKRGEVNSVTVTYEGSVTSNDTMTVNSITYPLSKKDRHGVLQFDLPNHHHYAALYFTVNQRSMDVSLNLGTPSTVMDIPKFNIEVVQGRSIQIQPNGNLTFDLVHTIESPKDTVNINDVEVYLRSRSDDNLVILYRDFHFMSSLEADPVKLSTEELTDSEGRNITRVSVNVTDEDRGTVDLILTVNFNCFRNCLVGSIRQVVTVEFYGPEHEHAFDEGDIGFVQHYNDPPEVLCSESMRCKIECKAMGSNLRDIEITTTNPAGLRLPTNAVNTVSDHSATSRLKMDKTFLSDTGDYHCTVHSMAGQATRDISLFVYSPPKIDESESKITSFDNGTTLVTCVAYGVPAPNVTIRGMTSPDDYYDVYFRTLERGHGSRTDVYIKNPNLASSRIEEYCVAETDIPNYGRTLSDYYFIKKPLYW